MRKDVIVFGIAALLQTCSAPPVTSSVDVNGNVLKVEVTVDDGCTAEGNPTRIVIRGIIQSQPSEPVPVEVLLDQAREFARECR